MLLAKMNLELLRRLVLSCRGKEHTRILNKHSMLLVGFEKHNSM